MYTLILILIYIEYSHLPGSTPSYSESEHPPPCTGTSTTSNLMNKQPPIQPLARELASFSLGSSHEREQQGQSPRYRISDFMSDFTPTPSTQLAPTEGESGGRKAREMSVPFMGRQPDYMLLPQELQGGGNTRKPAAPAAREWIELGEMR